MSGSIYGRPMFVMSLYLYNVGGGGIEVQHIFQVGIGIRCAVTLLI